MNPPRWWPGFWWAPMIALAIWFCNVEGQWPHDHLFAHHWLKAAWGFVILVIWFRLALEYRDRYRKRRQTAEDRNEREPWF